MELAPPPQLFFDCENLIEKRKYTVKLKLKVNPLSLNVDLNLYMYMYT